MRTKLQLLILLIFSTYYSIGQSDCTPIPEVNFPGGRVVMSFDGNVHDDDDIVAMGYAAGLWWAAGLQDKVVQIEYNNHICDTDVSDTDGVGAGSGDDSRNMRTTASGAIENFGYSSSIFYDHERQASASTAKMAAEIEKSTASNPLWILAGGPMETVWRGLEAANGGFDHVTIISHSIWNENHTHCSGAHDWNDLKTEYQSKGVFFVENCDSGGCSASNKLNDQNGGFNSALNNWEWMLNSDKEYNRWIYSRNPWSSRFDPSDAGMSYFLITGGPFNGGNKTPDHNDARKLLENPCQNIKAPVENQAPNLSFKTPSKGASFKVGDAVSVEANAGDTDGTITEVSLYLNDDLVRTDMQAPYQWGNQDSGLKNLKAGEYRLKMTATDNDGATSTTTLVFSIVEVAAPEPKNVLPVVSIASPQNNQIFYTGDDVSIDVSAKDDGNIVKHQIFVNGNLQYTNSGNFTPYVIKNIAKGSYTIRVEATDDDGGKTVKTIGIKAEDDETVEVPTKGEEEVETPNTETPTFNFISPPDGSDFVSGGTITVDLAATNGSDIVKYQVFINDKLVDTDPASFTPYRITNAQKGTYTIRAEATGSNGTKTVKEIDISIKEKANEDNSDDDGKKEESEVEETETPDTKSAAFNFVSPADGSGFASGGTITVDLAATKGSDIVKYQIFVNDKLVDTDPANFTPYRLTNAKKGRYTIKAEATNSSGAKTVKTVVVTVSGEGLRKEDTGTVKLSEGNPAENDGPISLSVSPEDGSYFVEGASVSVNVSASATGSTIVKHQIYVNGSLVDTDPAYFTPYAIANVKRGTYTVKVEVTDKKGRKEAKTLQFDVGSTAIGLVARVNLDRANVLHGKELPLRIAPNPVEGSQMNVFQKRRSDLRITNIYGTLVKQIREAGETEKIDVAGLAPGLYILESDNGSAKFIVPE